MIIIQLFALFPSQRWGLSNSYKTTDILTHPCYTNKNKSYNGKGILQRLGLKISAVGKSEIRFDLTWLKMDFFWIN